MKTLEKTTFCSLLALIIWLPIPLGSNRIWAWSIAEIWIALQSLMLIIAYRGQLPLSTLKKYHYLLTALLVFQAWVFFQTLSLPIPLLEIISPQSSKIYEALELTKGSISVDSRMTRLSFFKGIGYLLLVINAIFLVKSSNRLKLLVSAMIISGTLQAFYGASLVMLKVSHSPVFGEAVKSVATGSFVYKNHLANYLMMMLCMGVGLIITQLHLKPAPSWGSALKRTLEGLLSSKTLVRMCLVIMVIALVMTRSRMGNSAFFAAITIGGIVALLFYKNRPYTLPALVASVVAVDALVLGSLFGLEKVKQRLVETSFVNESRDQVVIWSLDIIRDFPITGTGMATFYSIFPSYTQAAVGFYDHAHNDYIQFIVEAGIPATLILASVILLSLFRCITVIRRRHSRTMKGIALGCLMATTGMLIHASVDFSLQPTANAATFVLILFIAQATYVLPATKSIHHHTQPSNRDLDSERKHFV